MEIEDDIPPLLQSSGKANNKQPAFGVYHSALQATGKGGLDEPRLDTSAGNYNIDSQKGGLLGKRNFATSSSKGPGSSIHIDPK